MAFVLLLGAPFLVGRATELRWHWSNPLPHGNNIFGLAHHPDRYYVQVTDRGQLYTSTDLGRWEARETGTRRALRGATFLGTRLIVSGEAGTILWADDPQEIRRVDLETEDWLEGVAASPDVAVAVGDNGAVYRSVDGDEWVRQSLGSSIWLRGIVWGGGLFVAVGEEGGIFTSADGVAWTRRTVSNGNGAHLNKVAWTGSGFVVAGDAVRGAGTVVFGSADGTEWNPVQPASGATRDLIGAAAESAAFRLVVGDLEVRRYSTLPVPNWAGLISNDPEDGPPPATYLTALWDGGQFLVAGRTGRVLTAQRTPLSLEWREYPSPPRSWMFDSTVATSVGTNVQPVLSDGQVQYLSSRTTNDFFVAAGDYATLMTSDTGVRWSPALPPTNAASRTYLGVAGNAHRLVAVGNGGLISVSPVDYVPLVSTVFLTNGVEVITVSVTNEVNTLGLAWYPAVSPTSADLQAACATGELMVIGGDGGFLATSTDGTNWTQRASGTTAFLSGLESSPEGFVAVGDAGTLLTSPDAIVWTRRTVPASTWIYRVRHAHGAWVAVGEGGTILTSTNRQDWESRATGVTNWLNDVEWTGGTWIVAGNQGTVLTSTNLVDWRLEESVITGKSLYTVSTLADRVILAGVDGVILRTRVVPFHRPVEFVHYPSSPSAGLFQFQGETDQRFRLDRASSLNQAIPGPVLEITDPSGVLLYFDPTPNDPENQFFLAPTLP